MAEDVNGAERAKLLGELREDVAKLVRVIRNRRIGERAECCGALHTIARAIEAGASQSTVAMLKDAALEAMRASEAKRKPVPAEQTEIPTVSDRKTAGG